MSDDRPAPGEQLSEGPEVPARQAASVIVLREAAGAPEVLLVQRNPDSRFMGGAWVFPGGSLLPEDADHAAAAVRELEEEAALRVTVPGALVPFSRWITPARISIRFDTHFFITAAEAGASAVPDGREIVDVRWLPAAEALAAAKRGKLSLMFPTIRHLEQLTEFRSVDAALAAAREREISPIQPRIVMRDGAPHVLLPGEDGFDEATD